MAFGDIMRETVRDTEGNIYGDVDMAGWEIGARRFKAPIREGFHYFGTFNGITYVGPCNSADDVWGEILDIRAEIRAEMFGHHRYFGRTDGVHAEIERASVIALARRLDAATLDAEACAAGPGRYEGAEDLALVVALDILSTYGCADDSAGSTEFGGLALQRFGRYVLIADDRGFISAEAFATDDLAQSALDAENVRQNPADEEM